MFLVFMEVFIIQISSDTGFLSVKFFSNVFLAVVGLVVSLFGWRILYPNKETTARIPVLKDIRKSSLGKNPVSEGNLDTNIKK